jgi:transcriptional regulator GlxA family with amidase domain
MVAASHLGDLARLRRVRDRIDREYAQPLDVESLARAVDMSAKQLSRAFAIAYGESLDRHLITRRITCAEALLRRGDLSVSEVCSAVGCTSVTAFSTRFAELVGVSPTVYRSTQASSAVSVRSAVTGTGIPSGRNQEAAAAVGT